MQQLIEEFKRIGTENDLRAFLEKNGFRVADSRSHPDQHVLGLFTGKTEGHNVKVTHRLISGNATPPAQGNEHRLSMEIDNVPPVEVNFAGSY